MSDIILGEFEEPVIPVWGDGSLTAMCWASQQRCPSPLAKLILLRLADSTGAAARSAFYIGNMAEWCCADVDDTERAINALGNVGLLQVFLNDNIVDVALPWWRDDRPRTFKTSFVKTDLRRELWDAQGGRCWYCGCDLSCDHLCEIGDDGSLIPPEGRVACEIEHQTPKSKGGGDAKANLVLSCKPCNRAKRSRTVEEYRSYLAERTCVAVVFHGERQLE
jgi:5-methylcytosine-specific restriction endonuclease McrA